MNEQDFLKELGFLSFVTRLKRVSDAMIHDGRRLYKELGMDIEPNWYVIFKLLEKNGEMTVTEIADEIGFAHPSVITIVNKMLKAGYLESNQCGVDSRRRLLILSGKAKSQLPEFERVWRAGTTGVKRMLADTDALNFLDSLEEKIEEKGFKERTTRNLEKEKSVKIYGYESKYAKDFAKLNYEWIEEFHEIEEHDREQLDNPKEHIISLGGEILIAKIGKEAVGAVALIKMDDENFELAKMGVTSKFRGFSIGKQLMEACIDYANKNGIKRLMLESNTKLIPAIKLYKKYGFKEIPLDPNTPYERANIRMELIL